MATRDIHYRDEEYNLVIHLRQARVVDGMRRSRIIQENLGQEVVRTASTEEEAAPPPLETLAHRVIALYTYPTCLAAATAVENLKSYTDTAGKKHPFTGGKELSLDITLDEFLELPEALAVMWEEAAYELNPHWMPRLRPPAQVTEAEATTEAEPATDES